MTQSGNVLIDNEITDIPTLSYDPLDDENNPQEGLDVSYTIFGIFL